MPVGPTPPLRSLLSQPVTRFLPMSLTSLRQPPSSTITTTTTFRRFFPFKLKYLGVSSRLGFQTTCNYSTRPFNSRPKSMSKSLIEDEDDLSDWVSGLRGSSVRTGVFTDDDEGQERGGGKKRGRESNFALKGGGADGEERGFRERGLKGFRGSGNVGGSYGRGGSGGRFGGEDGKGREFGRGGRGGRGGGGDRGGGRFGVKGKEREFGARNGRGGRGGGGSRGGGSRGRAVYVSEEEEKDEFELRNGRGGGRRERGGGGSRGGGIRGRGVYVSEEEGEDFGLRNEEKSVSGFMDLIGEDDDSEEDMDDEDDDDEEEEEIVIKSRSSLFGNEDEKLRTGGASSSEGGESYLSETRSAFS